MAAFLDRLAQLLLEQHGPHLERVLVVLPGRRAGLHLRKYLAQRHGAALWSPELLDPADFLEQVSGWKQASISESLLALHACHRELAGANADSLPDFLRWAPTTLRDMSAVDAHLIGLEPLYRDLRNYHEIEEWSMRDLEKPSPAQGRLLKHWESTGQLHRLFTKHMSECRVGTYGAIARAAQQIAADPGWKPRWDMIWAAGLNALDPASLAVLQALKKRGLLRVAWDSDRFYLDDVSHEAGAFLRKAIPILGAGEIEPGHAIAKKGREIEMVELADRASMVRFAGQWVSSIPEEQRSSAAIILADEQLLLPLVEALPAELGPVNVSMGVPLSALPAHGLIALFARLGMQAHLRTNDLVSLFSHPMLNQGSMTEAVVAKLIETGWPEWERPAVLELILRSNLPAQAGAALAEAHAQPSARIRALLSWAREVRRGDPLAEEQLFLIAEQERVLNAALLAYQWEEVSFGGHLEIRDRLFAEGKLNLFGEPLRGLQILGVLETRAIDFEHVLVLGASEGTLAGREDQLSWIPFELRRHLGLPGRRDRDALSSYHTHRLLHGAKRLCLAHAPAPDGGGSPVRFVQQWHQAFGEPSLERFRRTHVNVRTLPGRAAPIRIHKDETVLSILRALLQRGISPSALGAWLRCPQDFHARYVLGIRDDAAIAEDLRDDALGRAVHKAAQWIYEPWIGQVVKSHDLITAAANAEALVRRALSSEFPNMLLDSGTFLIKGTMAGEALRRALLVEADACGERSTVTLALEKELRAELRPGVWIMGKADRIERRDGTLCVIDLKTGTVNPKELDLPSLDRESMGPDRTKALQLLMYAVMALHVDPGINEIQAGIQPLRKPSQSHQTWLRIGGDQTIKRDQLPDMEALLLTLVDELMDERIPFMHRSGNTYCACCVE